MSNPSNLYAEKVFAEHPIALWPLDDQVDYISLIDEDQRNFSDSNIWSVSGGTASLDFSLVPPFGDSSTNVVETSGTNVLISSSKLVDKYLSQNLKTVSFGFYAYEEFDNNVEDKVVDSFTFSLTYDPEGQPHFNNSETVSKQVVAKSGNRWHHYSVTFNLPDDEIILLELVEVFVGTPAIFTLNSHGLSQDDRVFLSVDGTLPGNFEENTVYYVNYIDTDRFSLSLTPGGTSVVATQTGVNTPSITLIKDYDFSFSINLNRESNAKVYLNGFTVGQWSEEFQDESLGIGFSNAPNIDLGSAYSAIPSSSYGLSDSKAYYLVNNNELLAKNINMPMVFGSRNLTSISADLFGAPSLIFPGSGVFNEAGRYRTYTIEFWLKINANTSVPRRIFGPISSDYGLYVDGPLLTLKIGNQTKSHYVGDMYRPMIINLIVFENGASISINGETVLNMEYSSANLELSDNLSSEGFEQDWLGFYSYDDINKFEVDCFAIYPYRVDTSVAKRRYVYGQAVDFPENITSVYNGKSFMADATFARQSNSYVYPDIGQWERGNIDNLSLDKNILSTPRYELPRIVFDNKTESDWYESLGGTYANTLMLKPNDNWNNTNGYFYFDKLNLKDQNIRGIYGVFEAPINYSTRETLFFIENAINKNYLYCETYGTEKEITSVSNTILTLPDHDLSDYDVIRFTGELPAEVLANKEYFVKYIDKDNIEVSEDKDGESVSFFVKPEKISVTFIRYRMKYGNNDEYTVFQTPSINFGTTFVAGIDIDSFSNTFGGNVSALLKNKAQLRAYFGGKRDFSSTYSGYIYRIGFSTKRNLDKLSYLFDTNGVPFLRYQFDGGTDVSSSWTPEETIDAGEAYQIFVNDILSHKATYTLFLNTDFNQYSLDIATDSSWQDYVPLQYFSKSFTNGAGKKEYGLSFLQFNIDYPQPNIFYDGEYDARRSRIRTYVSFQYVEDGANKLDEEFSATLPLPRSNVVTPESNWQETKYEVVDSTIIYPPAGVKVDDLAIVLYIEMKVDGIISKPIRVKKLGLSSKALNAIGSNKVYSALGSYVSPYLEYGFYQDSDGYNPYSVYNDSTPYLYLTKNSGLQLRGEFPLETDRGLRFLINQERKATVDLASIQTSMYFSSAYYLENDMSLFEVDGKRTKYIFRTRSLDAENRRVNIYATDQNGNELNNIGFYLNGRFTTRPVVTVGEWNMLGVAFVNPINLDRSTGSLNLNGPALFNNISYYALTTLQEAQRDPGNVFYEDYSETDYVGVSPARLYQIYTGTNKIISGDPIVFGAEQYQYSIYKGLSLQTQTIKPA